MIGLDTNVVVRLLVDDDPDQARRAQQVLDERSSAQDPAFIGLIVITETFWALDRIYKYDRAQIAAALRHLLEANNVAVEQADQVRAALTWLDQGADLADALLSECNRVRGCTTTLTFDRGAAKRLPAFELLTA